MTDQTDFTQIAADFATSLRPANQSSISTLISETSTEAPTETSRPVERDDDEVASEIEPTPDLADRSDRQNDGDAANEGFDEEAPLTQIADAEASEDVAIVTDGDTEEAIDRDARGAIASAPSEPAAKHSIGGGIFSDFPAAPREQGEFLLPLCDLVIGEKSAGGVYNFDAGTAEVLLHAVQAPEKIAPVMVMKSDGKWHVVDGWARVAAMRLQFGNTANVPVRVVEWHGVLDDALFKRFASVFLPLRSRKIDKSMLLRQFHLAWSVPQVVLAARIGWTESRVTRELAAAQVFEEAPRFAELHVKAGDPPVDYLYAVQQARAAAAEDDAAHPKRAAEKGAVAKLEGRLEGLLEKPERYATAAALAKLGLGKSKKARSALSDEPPAEKPADLQALAIIDCVEDSTGEPIAMIEMGADQFPSIRLMVDAAAIDDRRKAEIRHLVHEALDRLLGF